MSKRWHPPFPVSMCDIEATSLERVFWWLALAIRLDRELGAKEYCTASDMFAWCLKIVSDQRKQTRRPKLTVLRDRNDRTKTRATNVKRGNYLWFDGMDGCGKTTLCQAVANRLRGRGEVVLDLAFPGNVSAVGRLIRRVFTGKEDVNSDAMMWLFVAEAKDLEPTVRRFLVAGDTVVCDRHTVVSGRIYQSKIHDLTAVSAVRDYAHLLQADRTYVVDVPAEVALDRRRLRNEDQNPLYESSRIDELRHLRNAYVQLAEDPTLRVKVLDGTRSIQQLVDDVMADMAELSGMRSDATAK